ncbi:DMT family transporter [Stagnihabitans tardus]|uniref:EamA family transporter n=1 Tax=Stagnihabitans tardus TaxID=2699202 RepID=A0AAE5BSS9_9RHOB|nr:DMT family transporter [Stagnihabitans tardus]NBZ88235.1 EamA family transporter [Stagnihabitans tardus]
MRYGTGAALVVAAGVVWSVQGVLIGNIAEAGSWTVLLWRSLGMLPVMLLWIGPGQTWEAIRAMGWAGVLGGLGLVFAFGGAITALQSTTVANAVLLFSASPFLAALFGRVILGERVSALTWGAIALALGGILVMVGGVGQIGGGTGFGTLAALLSAAGFAAFTVAVRWGRVSDTRPAVLLGGVFSMLVGGLVALVTSQPLLVPPLDISLAFGMGAVTLTGGMALYTAGSRVVPAAQATLFSLIEVLLAPLWAWAFLSETLSKNTAIGGAILLTAVALNAALGLQRR